MYFVQKKYQFNSVILSKTANSFKVKVRLLVASQEAKAVAPLSPILGQFGLSTQDFCKKFNEESTKYPVGLDLIVHLEVLFDRTFRFTINRFCFTSLLHSICEGETVKRLTILEFYRYAHAYTCFFGGELIHNVKSLLGTVRGTRIKIIVI
jgi:hypothetical protein